MTKIRSQELVLLHWQSKYIKKASRKKKSFLKLNKEKIKKDAKDVINFVDLKRKERRKTIQCVRSKGSPEVESAERKHRRWKAAICSQGRRWRSTGPSREERGGGEGKREERELSPSQRAGGGRDHRSDGNSSDGLVALTRRGEEIKKSIGASRCDHLPQ